MEWTDEQIINMARRTVARIASSARFYDNMIAISPVMQDEIERTLFHIIEDHHAALREAEQRGREAERRRIAGEPCTHPALKTDHLLGDPYCAVCGQTV